MKLAIPDSEFGGYIFDCDGTLADTMPLHYRARTRIVTELGGTFPIELFYQLGGTPTAQILSLLRDGHGLKVDDVQKAAMRKEEYFLEMIDEVKPIEAVVRWYGIKPLAVASGGFHRQIEQTLDALGIRSLFRAVVCAEDYARGKPCPDPFLEAARRLTCFRQSACECVKTATSGDLEAKPGPKLIRRDDRNSHRTFLPACCRADPYDLE